MPTRKTQSILISEKLPNQRFIEKISRIKHLIEDNSIQFHARDLAQMTDDLVTDIKLTQLNGLSSSQEILLFELLRLIAATRLHLGFTGLDKHYELFLLLDKIITGKNFSSIIVKYKAWLAKNVLIGLLPGQQLSPFNQDTKSPIRDIIIEFFKISVMVAVAIPAPETLLVSAPLIWAAFRKSREHFANLPTISHYRLHIIKALNEMTMTFNNPGNYHENNRALLTKGSYYELFESLEQITLFAMHDSHPDKQDVATICRLLQLVPEKIMQHFLKNTWGRKHDKDYNAVRQFWLFCLYRLYYGAKDIVLRGEVERLLTFEQGKKQQQFYNPYIDYKQDSQLAVMAKELTYHYASI